MEYISHEDYKKMLGSFGKEAPKKALNEMHTMQKDDGPSEFQRLPADFDEGLEKEGNAFTAGLAKTKKGGEFKVGNKSFKDKTNYDAPVNEYQFDQMYPDDPGPFEELDARLKEFLAKEDDVNWDRVDDEEAEENQTDNGIEEDDDSPTSYKFGIGEMVTVPVDYAYTPSKPLKILDREPNADACEAKVDFQTTDVIDIDWGADEGAWESVENEPWYLLPNHAPEEEQDVRSLWWPESEITKYAGINKLGKTQEDINLPSSQPTGPSIEETRRPLSHLSPEERDQLRQYVETIKTVKEQINKMVCKSDMEEGGDMTGLVMRPNRGNISR